MSDIVIVKHSVPVRYVPKGARKERLVYTRCETPVALRHVSASEVEQVARVDGEEPAEFHAHGGALWLRLEGRQDKLDWGFSPADAARFLQASWDRGSWTGSDVERAFLRTPVLPVPELGRFEPFDPDQARQVVDDGTEVARAALRGFLEESVLLAGEDVFLRTGGPMLSNFTGRGPSEGRYRVVPTPGSETFGCFATRPDRIGEFAAWQDRHWRFPALSRERAEVPRALRGIDPALYRDDDVRLFANQAPGLVTRALKPFRARMEHSGRCVALASELQGWVPYGQMGAVGEEDAEAVLRLAGGLVAAALEDVPFAMSSPHLSWAGHYIDEVLLPRLHEAKALPEADAAAFSGLRP